LQYIKKKKNKYQVDQLTQGLQSNLKRYLAKYKANCRG